MKAVKIIAVFVCVLLMLFVGHILLVIHVVDSVVDVIKRERNIQAAEIINFQYTESSETEELYNKPAEPISFCETTEETQPVCTTEPETVPETEQQTEEPAETTTDNITAETYAFTDAFPFSYSDDGVTIQIDRQWYCNTWCYVAHIQMTDYSRLKTGMAHGSYGASETVYSFAQRNDCLLTVNGDYAEGLGKCVLRNGVACNAFGSFSGTAYSQYSGMLKKICDSSIPDLTNDGFTDTFNFGAGDLVVDGISVYLRKDGGKSAQRTLIGTTGTPGDIYLVVTEGRFSDGVSTGLQYWQAGDLLESLGCTYGVALDGGGSSAMVWGSQILNHTTDRDLTGFIYITKS